jgi:hypothetical protein
VIPGKAEILALLDEHARLREKPAPVTLDAAYLRAIALWEGLPDNAEGADKTWVGRARQRWEAHFAKARMVT